VLRQALKFSISGLCATAVHVLVASSLITKAGLGAGLANGLAFLTATLFTLVINTYWSFSARITWVIFRRYALVAIVGFFLSTGISQLFDMFGHHYGFGIAAVVCIIPAVNFLMHHYWTYRQN
jgi:putative flippase GtrA